MSPPISRLRALHDLSRRLALAKATVEQGHLALEALRGDAPELPAAVLLFSEVGSEPLLLQGALSLPPEASAVTAKIAALREHCLVHTGAVSPAVLLEGPGLPHFEGYALSAIRSGDEVFGVLGRRAPPSPEDREFLCAVAAMLGTAIGMCRERLRAVEEERRRRRLARYLSPQISARLAEKDFESICCGERVRAAVLFSDLCGFTKLAACLDPEQVVWMLNRYLSEMTAVVFQNGGMIDKFLGDGLMAVFGVPEPLASPADAAVSCARGMLIAIDRLALVFAEAGLPELDAGIGIHYGEAVFGAVGDGDYADLTLIGPAVNLASRVESATRTLEARVLVTRELIEACREPPPVVLGGVVPLKGIAPARELFRPHWG